MITGRQSRQTGAITRVLTAFFARRVLMTLKQAHPLFSFPTGPVMMPPIETASAAHRIFAEHQHWPTMENLMLPMGKTVQRRDMTARPRILVIRRCFSRRIPRGGFHARATLHLLLCAAFLLAPAGLAEAPGAVTSGQFQADEAAMTGFLYAEAAQAGSEQI